MANHCNKFFTSMPADTVKDFNPVDLNDLPNVSRNFFQTDPEDDGI